ncbi:MAG TPA: helix-turn-helix domain-containing protein, partial [Chitinophagales bacterium]
QFPFTPLLPTINANGGIDFARTKLPVLKHNAQRLNIFRNLELLIIDEVSMVRADLLDQIDIVLRQTRRKRHLPFGGVQVLLIGDMYQLPPVVQRDEWNLLREVYNTPFFFDSYVMKQNRPVYIELEKIYRQNEATFINLLNKVRNNKMDEESLQLLNARYKENLTQKDFQNHITLTTHNRKADEINTQNLNALSEESYTFKCATTGSFSDKNFPADETLVLKKGTRVMFLKNNNEKNYYNGKIGVITYVDNEKIRVKCEEDRDEIDVVREVWTNVSYTVEQDTKHIKEEILGTFSQFPLRLAWAITIHKSQGLTFDKLIIDAAESFSAGQVYVALSRCRSLNSLTLSSRINSRALLNDNNILNFASTKQNDEQVNHIFSESKRAYIKTVLVGLFDLSEQTARRENYDYILKEHGSHLNSEGLIWGKNFFEKLLVLNETSVKFKAQLHSMIDASTDIENNENLQDRIRKAVVYFDVELKKLIDELRNCKIVTESKEAATEINDLLQELFESLYQKHWLIRKCEKGFVFADFVKNKLSVLYPNFRINVYASAKNTTVSADITHQQLYRELLQLRDEICARDGSPIFMVASKNTLTELANYLPKTKEDLLRISGFGTVKVQAYGDEFLRVINSYVSENNLESAMSQLKPKRERKTKKEILSTSSATKAEKPNTRELTFQLFKQGLDVAEIATQRNLAISTIEGHLLPYLENGDILIDDLLSKEKQKMIREALDANENETSSSVIKSQLPDD